MTMGWGIVIGSLVGAAAYCPPSAGGFFGFGALVLIVLALWSGDPEPTRCCRCCKCEDCDDE